MSFGIGRENDPSTRTRRSWMEPASCGWSPSIAGPDTSRLAKRRTDGRTRGRPGVYLRAEPEDVSILDGPDDRQRAALIAERLRQWKAIAKG